MSAAPDGSKLTTSVSEHSFFSRSVSVRARYLGWRLILVLTAELAWLLASSTALAILSQAADEPAAVCRITPCRFFAKV
jgi:hypothetical protein